MAFHESGRLFRTNRGGPVAVNAVADGGVYSWVGEGGVHSHEVRPQLESEGERCGGWGSRNAVPGSELSSSFVNTVEGRRLDCNVTSWVLALPTTRYLG